MAKFRSYFVSDLEFLNSAISDLLALNSDSLVDESSFDKFLESFEGISILLCNRDYLDLIRKK